VFFLVLTVVQVGYAAAVLIRPSVPLLKAGALASLAVVALWIVSRTVGVPIGPEPGEAEAVGTYDLLATISEALAALACLAAVRALRSGRYGRRGNPATATSAVRRIVPNALPQNRSPQKFDLPAQDEACL
jgi:hypothetical protein